MASKEQKEKEEAERQRQLEAERQARVEAERQERQRAQAQAQGATQQPGPDAAQSAPPVAEPSDATTPDLATRTLEREIAERRHTRLGGPFADDRHDPTETDEGIAARRGQVVSRTEAQAGLKKYRTTQPMYRNGVYVEAGSVIAVPDDEEPSLTWEDAEEDAGVHFPFPREPDTEEKKAARERRVKLQERATRRAAQAAARSPQVMATAIAAREAGQVETQTAQTPQPTQPTPQPGQQPQPQRR